MIGTPSARSEYLYVIIIRGVVGIVKLLANITYESERAKEVDGI